MEPNSPSRGKLSKARSHGRTARFCAVLVIALILLSVAAAYHWFKSSDRVLGRPYFSVVVDCGSTGTRVNVYEWETRAGSSPKRLPVLLHSYPDSSTRGWKSGCTYHCMQTEPGLDKLVGNSSGIRASLEPLIRWAEGVVPPERHRETPLLVLATAGLRSMPSKDAEWILEDVEGVIKDHRFAYSTSWMRVLSGKEEAYFGWAALNYKMGILDSSPPVNTVGLLDLGGSSLQVVMEIDEPGDKDHMLRPNVGSNNNKTDELFAVSIPEFGLNEAFDRSVAMLSGEGFGGEVRHPCLGSSFEQNYTCINCFDERSNSSENQFKMVGGRLSKLMYVVGDPDMELCERLVKAAALNVSISDWSNTRTLASCKGGLSSRDGAAALGLPMKSNPDLRFHALSGFFVVFNMLDLPETASMSEIWNKAQQLCSRLWTDISGKQHLAPHYCFKALYMVSLITDALCLGNSDIIFGPGDVSWTLGASLVQQEKSSDKTSRGALGGMLSTKYGQLVFSPVTVLVVLLLASYVVYHYQVKLPMPQRSAAPTTVLPCYNNHLKQRPR